MCEVLGERQEKREKEKERKKGKKGKKWKKMFATKSFLYVHATQTHSLTLTPTRERLSPSPPLSHRERLMPTRTHGTWWQPLPPPSLSPLPSPSLLLLLLPSLLPSMVSSLAVTRNSHSYLCQVLALVLALACMILTHPCPGSRPSPPSHRHPYPQLLPSSLVIRHSLALPSTVAFFIHHHHGKVPLVAATPAVSTTAPHF